MPGSRLHSVYLKKQTRPLFKIHSAKGVRGGKAAGYWQHRNIHKRPVYRSQEEALVTYPNFQAHGLLQEGYRAAALRKQRH